MNSTFLKDEVYFVVLHFSVLDSCSPGEGGVVGGVKVLESIKVDPITTNDVITSITHTKPSSANGLNNKYTLWQKQYESN